MSDLSKDGERMNKMRKSMIEINEMGDPPIPMRTRIKTNRFYIYLTKGFVEWISDWRNMPFLLMWVYAGITYLMFHAAEWTFLTYCGIFD